MQTDGNSVIYGLSGVPLWSTNTGYSSGFNPYTLVLQLDNNVVLYDSRGVALWATQTS